MIFRGEWSRVDWKLVAQLAPGGAVLGLGSVLGIIRVAVEPFAWVLLGVAWILILASRAQEAPRATGFVVGVLGGYSAPVLQTVFLSTYVDRNPEVAAIFASLPPGFPGGAGGFILLSGTLISLVFGGITAWGTVLAIRARAKGEAAARRAAGRR